MAYTIPGSEIRHTGCDVGYRPRHWHCDPCAPSHRRYVVDGAEYPWFEIIDPFDDERAERVKLDVASKVAQIAAAQCELHRQLRNLGAV